MRLLDPHFSKSSEEFMNLQPPPVRPQDQFQRHCWLIPVEITKTGAIEELRKDVSVDGRQE